MVEHLPGYRQHLGRWVEQKQADPQAHLLGHGAPKVLQHIQHPEDVKCMRHLYPLESTCLRGGEEKQGLAIKSNHKAEKAKRHLDTVLADRMANGVCLMGWILQW